MFGLGRSRRAQETAGSAGDQENGRYLIQLDLQSNQSGFPQQGQSTVTGQEELSGEAQAHSVFKAQGVPGFTVDKNPRDCLGAGLVFAGIGLGV